MCITSFTSFKNFKRKIFAAVFVGVMSLCMTSCSDDDPINRDDPLILPPMWIAIGTSTIDYTTSNFKIMLTEDYTILSANDIPGLEPLHALSGDIAIRSFLGDVYILERFGKDNVIKISGEPQIMYQQSLGEALNIQDIAVVSQNKAYISALQDHNLIVFDPQAGNVLSMIDMSQFNSFAGTENEFEYPYVASLAYYNNRLYATCQRLDPNTWDIGDVSVIAIINTQTDEITESIELSKKNPASMSMFGNRMLVSSQGSWMETGGEYAGIEIIDIETNTKLDLIIEGSDLGGNPSDIIFVSENKAYVVVGGEWGVPAWVVSFDPTTGTIGARIDGIADASGGLAFDGEKLYVGDRGLESAAGVAVVDIVNDEVLLTIPTNMPPSAIAIVR